jgi:sugar lactone lactonase YvrE
MTSITSRLVRRVARWALLFGTALSVSACGSGDGDDPAQSQGAGNSTVTAGSGSDPSAGAGAGAEAGGAATAEKEFLVLSGGDACGGTGCSTDRSDGGGVGGSGDGGGGAGAGAGLSAMRNVTVVVSKPDGTELGRAPLVNNLVSLYPQTYRGPLILKFVDAGGGEYWDEATRQWTALAGRTLHLMVPTLTHHVSANPLTEAAYQWAIKQFGSERALTAASMQQANDRVLGQINAKLPAAYRTTDVTNYVTPISDMSGAGTLTNTWAGRYGAVLAALPIAAARHNPQLEAPALAFTDQLSADIKDDGVFNVSAAVPSATVAYDGAVAAKIGTGICTAVAEWGSQAMPAQLAPQSAGAARPGQLTLLAGSVGGAGNCDGWGANARFSDPAGVAVDGLGNVYVADLFNHTIRKISPAGAVSTLAGMPGSRGSADGTGLLARFYAPQGVAVDANGIVYVADSGNNTIRRITPQGTVSTIAGSPGTQGSTNATGPAARFFNPRQLTLDRNGNLLVADTLDNTIRRVTPAGVVTTFAGTSGASGSGCAGSLLSGPVGVAADAAGNVYVSNEDSTICRIASSGSMSLFGNTASSTDGDFFEPRGIAADAAGNVYVADSFNEIVRRISPAGAVTTLAGSKVTRGSSDGTGAQARFRRPNAVAVDAAGNAYVADRENNTIRRISPSAQVTTFAGTASVPGTADGTGTAAQFNSPGGSVADAQGNLFVVDTRNQTIRRITPDGTVSTFVGSPGQSGSLDGTGTDAQFSFSTDGEPNGITIDRRTGVLYVADTGNCTIRAVTPDRRVSTYLGQAGVCGSVDGAAATATFMSPRSVAFHSQAAGAGTVDTLYIADSFNHTIRRSVSQIVTTIAGTAGLSGSADGVGAAARFDQPTGVAVDAAGDLYVADYGNATVRKITIATRSVETLAGLARSPGDADGIGSAARFLAPTALDVNAAGEVFVATAGLDFRGNTAARTVRRISPAGVVTTVVGTAGGIGNLLGALPASLGKLSSVSVVSDKQLVVTSDDGVYLATFE